MSFTAKQKKWITKKHKKLSAKKIASGLNVSEAEVKEFIATFKMEPPKKKFYLALVAIPLIFFIIYADSKLLYYIVPIK